ncbi:MAG: VOC family protein [Desulfobulbus sp.]|nr:MAG: VOC family protein [Desulfobulbus sp.]
MNPKPHHLALKVRDLERCEHFYANVLGLESKERLRATNGTLRSVWFDLGGMILMLERCASPDTAEASPGAAYPERPGWHLLALTVAPDSRADWRERLRRAGVTITGESDWSIYFRDPEGNRLALCHYPEQAPP